MPEILVVHARAGASLSHALPSIAAQGRVHLLAVMALPEHDESAWRPHCAEVTDISADRLRGDRLVDTIVSHAKRIGADAVLTTSEYAILAVSHAAERLGLPGAGTNTILARDKRLMRQRWAEAGVPIPGFRSVTSAEELAEAFAELTTPILLKSAWGAGSVGQYVVRSAEDVPAAWAAANEALAADRAAGYVELYDEQAHQAFIAEELIEATTEGWYAEPGHGDYVSVEGIVVDGDYYPLAITGRLPTVGAFTELGNTAPSALPEHLQRRIEEASRAAVDALGLSTCGTHTEIKLKAGGRHALIETAARFGGGITTTLLHDVYNVDGIAALTRALLGDRSGLPSRMLTGSDATGAAATLLLLPATTDGVPWTSTPIWRPEKLERMPLRSPESSLDIVTGLSLPAGERVPAYRATRAALNVMAIGHLKTSDPETLVAEARHVFDNAEAALGKD